ncbi:MAG: murein biosynthesis integral membrane protein MurJ, partial [Verrucomicrobiaceae bacterium]
EPLHGERSLASLGRYIDKRWFPMMVSFIALGLNLAFNWFFVFVMKWGHESLALTTSISASVNFLLLYFAMRKFAGDLGTGQLLLQLVKLLLAGSVMVGVCLLANRYLFADLAHTLLVMKVVYLGLTIGVASAVYFVVAKLLRVSEADDALGMITRKLRR